MAIKNTALGGTDWVQEGMNFADVNDTFNAVVTRRQKFTDAGPYTHTGDINWSLAVTFSLTQAVNSLLTGFYFKADIKTSFSGITARCAVRLNGTNLGDVGFILGTIDTASGAKNIVPITGTSRSGTGANSSFQTTSTTTVVAGFTSSPNIKLTDANTDIEVDINIDNAARTVTLTNIECRAVWVEEFDEV